MKKGFDWTEACRVLSVTYRTFSVFAGHMPDIFRRLPVTCRISFSVNVICSSPFQSGDNDRHVSFFSLKIRASIPTGWGGFARQKCTGEKNFLALLRSRQMKVKAQ